MKTITKNRVQLRFDKMAFGWSIPAILSIASIASGLVTSVLQYWVINTLTMQFRNIYQQEIETRLLFQLQSYNPRVLRSIQLQDRVGLGDLARQLMLADPNFRIIYFYDVSGTILQASISSKLSDARWSDLKKSMAWETLPSARIPEKSLITIQTVTTSASRYLDAVMRVELRSDYNQNLGVKYGYTRSLISLDKIDKKIAQIKFISVLFVILTTLSSTIIFLLFIRKTVLSPIERAVNFLHKSVSTPSHIPNLAIHSTDARQVKELLHALYEGISEISMRQRIMTFVEQTRVKLQNSAEKNFLQVLQEMWIQDRLVSDCQLVLARYSKSQRKYQIEASSDEGHTRKSSELEKLGSARTRRKSVRLEVKLEFNPESVLRFLATNMELYWTDAVLHARMNLGTSADLFLVLSIAPDPAAEIAPEQLEELVAAWLTEVVHLHSQIKYRDLSGKLELAHELKRKWINGDLRSMERFFAAELLPSGFVNGDFLFVHKYENRNCTLSILGDVAGHDIRSGIAANGILAVISERHLIVKDDNVEDIMKDIARSIQQYMWRVYNGSIGCAALIVYFDHNSGQGQLAQFGLSFPFQITPQERKPMVIASGVNHGFLGLSSESDCIVTPFSVMSGQIVLACTHGLLEIENSHGKTFERAIAQGILSPITERNIGQNATQLLNDYLQAARDFAESRIIQDDLTGIVLAVTPTP